MKIAILSDFHFGYAYNSELESDSFENAENAMEKALDSDLIIIAGDIFDSRMPKTNVWARAIRILVKPLIKGSSGIKLVSCSKELKEISKRTLNHIPVIAIHGTHERRGKGETNVIEALENAGILIHLHQNSIVFEKDGEKVAVHGMSGVPERFAKDVLYNWDPTPVENCFNILLFHQSIEPYIYSPLDPPSLSLSNLPEGFDLIVDGHIHISSQQRLDNSIIILPGSTIATQMEKNEANSEKGFFEIETGKELKINFRKIEKQRRFFYEEVKVGDKSVRDQIETKLKDILSQEFSKPPIIKLKIIGNETDVLDQELKDVEKKYAGKTILNLVKELESAEASSKAELLRNLREQKLSVEDFGLSILKTNLEEMRFESSFDYDNVFKLLSEGESERAFNILIGEQKTLEKILKVR